VAAASFQWYRTYISLYMVALGVTAVQIGWLESVLIFTQFISTLLGGYFADRFGRKRVLVVFDILCWGVPMFLYAIARNPWYFLIGRFINGFVYIVIPSFQCLFVEDVPSEHRSAVFGMVQFLMSGARLLAPVAGVLVAMFGIIVAGRGIMVIVMLSSIAIAVVRQFTLEETSMGRKRMADTLGLDAGELVRQYRMAIRSMVENRQVLTYMIVRNLVAFNTLMWATYSAIYLTDARGIGLSESTVALFPFVSALVTMGMIVFAARRMQERRTFSNLIVGQLLGIVSAVFFVVSPPGTIWWAVLWAVVNALSVALFRPANDAYWANIVGDRERALIFSTSGALMSLFTLPAGPLAGMLYTASPRGPFVLGAVIQVAALLLTLTLHRGGVGCE
jgi:MFS transporter, DHA1 family, tetracycline resistance protein